MSHHFRTERFRSTSAEKEVAWFSPRVYAASNTDKKGWICLFTKYHSVPYTYSDAIVTVATYAVGVDSPLRYA